MMNKWLKRSLKKDEKLLLEKNCKNQYCLIKMLFKENNQEGTSGVFSRLIFNFQIKKIKKSK